MNAWHNRRILLVDDNRAIHADFRKILTQGEAASALAQDESLLFGTAAAAATLGFELDSAYQGQEALAKVRTALLAGLPYALTFVDIRMPPGWDGLETIERLWQADPCLQVVICTAYSDYSLAQVLERLGPSDQLLILKKPFDGIEIRQLANALCTKWQMTRQAQRHLHELEAEVLAQTAELRQANEALLEQIQERQRAEQALRLKHWAIESSLNAIFLTDNSQADNPLEYVNPAFERITGYSATEASGSNIRFLLGDDGEQPGFQTIQDSMRNACHAQAVLRNYRKDGSPFWCEWYIAPVRNEDGHPSHFVGILNDITETKLLEEQLQNHAYYDALTGLPNRVLLMDRMNQVIAAASHQTSRITVAFIDLDRFKLINDSLGHAAGDTLLQAIAARLLECVRESDTVARLGGDEFVILLPDELADAALIPWLQRIGERIAQPLALLGEERVVTCSIGISIYPQDGDSSETLLKHADTAMYRAKEIGRNSFQFFMPEMNVRLTNRLRLETDLQRALERCEFELYYQPQVDLRSGTISGCEALIRWHHPERGLVLPAHFIPTAEESDLILAIGTWVIRQAAAQCQSWQAAGLPALPVAVNLSARQFDRQDIPALIASVLEENALEPGWLEVEITEGLSMQAPHKTLEFVRQLRALGVGVAIDDFGTGFSNLSYLKQFPVNKLKLDYCFVNGIASNPEDIAISTAIIEMGHSLHLKVIAEGVERESQLAILAARGCDQLQGYLFSPPLTAEDFAALVRSGRRLPVPRNGKPQTQPTLLIVDDDRLALSSLRRTLAARRYRVVLVAGTAQAFELLATQRVDVLLSDHRMPQMNGLEFLEKVRHMYPGIVRLMLSGFAEQDLLLNAINQGTLFKFLCKPWTHEELCQALDEAFALANPAC